MYKNNIRCHDLSKTENKLPYCLEQAPSHNISHIDMRPIPLMLLLFNMLLLMVNLFSIISYSPVQDPIMHDPPPLVQKKIILLNQVVRKITNNIKQDKSCCNFTGMKDTMSESIL